VFAISSIGKKLWQKLQRPVYRHAYLAEHVRRGIAYQIRALRDQRGWNQGKFSNLLGKPQSVVCRLEDPSYGKVTIQTLLEIANVYDVALDVRFVPYSSFLQRTRDVSAASMRVPEFKDDFLMTSAKAPTSDRSKWTIFADISGLPTGNRPIWIDRLNAQEFVAVQRDLTNLNDASGNTAMIANALSSAVSPQGRLQ